MPNSIYISDPSRAPSGFFEYMNTHAVGDFNGDGKLDVVGAFTSFGQNVTHPISIFSEDSSGKYVDIADSLIIGSVPLTFQGRATVIADFNGDGVDDIFIADTGPDLILQSPGAHNVLLLSQNGRLVNASNTLPNVSDFTHTVSSGDIDGDGDVDVFVGNFTSMHDAFDLPYFLINDGSGHFSQSVGNVPLALRDDRVLQIGSSAVGDFTGDGKADLIIGAHGGIANRLYVGDGTGDFSDASFVALPVQRLGGEIAPAVWIHAFDMDNDGRQDLALSHYGPPSDFRDPNSYAGRALQVLRNTGNGTFDDVTDRFPLAIKDDSIAPSQWFVSLRSADINSDGVADLYANNLNTAGEPPSPNTPVVWLSDGSGGYKVLDQSYFGNQFGYAGYPSPFEFVDGQNIFSIGSQAEFLERLIAFDLIGAQQQTLVLSGARSLYDVNVETNGLVALGTVGTNSQTFAHVTRVEFTDGSLVFDLPSQNAAPAYRLYGGAFDRTPDEAGLRFWTNDWLETGRTLHDAALGFLQSAEFTERYGINISDASFVDQLYQNVLHRPGEQAGIEYWNDFLAQQTGDRADVLVNFTQLPEYVANSLDDVEDGFWVI